MASPAIASSSHLRGILIVAAGAFCLVPDGTLIRLADASDLQIMFWRALMLGLSIGGVVAWRHRAQTLQAYRAIGRTGLLVGLTWGLALVSFVYSINHTEVANTLVIIATTPFIAALFTRRLIGEPIHRHTWLAMLAVVGGMALTFAGALHLESPISGNLAAVAVATALGLNLTLIRRAGEVDMLPALSIAGLVAAAVTLPVAWPVGVTGRDVLVIGAMGGVLLPAAFTLFTIGTRYLPSPEVSLLMTLETVFGPLLAWLVVDEAPPPFAVAGGAVVIATLVLHSLAMLRPATATQPL